MSDTLSVPSTYMHPEKEATIGGVKLRVIQGGKARQEIIDDSTTILESPLPLNDADQTFLKEGKISPESLYKVVNNEQPNSSKVLEIRRTIKELLDYLEDALKADDNEIEKETVMTYFAEGVFKLNKFLKTNDNFDEAVCLLEVAVAVQNKSVYSREKIFALKKALNLLRDNIYLPEDKLDEFCDILEDAGFDLRAPMGDVDFE